MGDEDRSAEGGEANPSRRTLLRSAGVGAMIVAGGTGAAASTGSVSGVFSGETTSFDEPTSALEYERVRNCGEDISCPDGLLELAKYEFDGCRFEFDDGSALDASEITITYDPQDDTYNKDGQDCEPIAFDWELGINYVHYITACGGRAEDGEVVDIESDEGGRSGTFPFDGKTPGGQQATISNVRFCAGVCFQVDLVKGPVIETLDPGAGETYLEQDRLIQARWGGIGYDADDGLTYVDEGIDHRGSLDGCDVDLVTDIEFDFENDEASITFEPDCPEGEQFSLVAYRAPCPPRWSDDRAPYQRVSDTDQFTTDGDDGTITLTVDLPRADDDGVPILP